MLPWQCNSLSYSTPFNLCPHIHLSRVNSCYTSLCLNSTFYKAIACILIILHLRYFCNILSKTNHCQHVNISSHKRVTVCIYCMYIHIVNETLQTSCFHSRASQGFNHVTSLPLLWHSGYKLSTVFNSISFFFLPCLLYPSHLCSVCPRC